MSDMPSLDAAGRAGRRSACSAAEQSALEEASRLAETLRERLEALRWGAWDGWDHSTVLADALTAIETLRGAVAGLGGARPWSEVQALDPEVRVDRRALAGVRTLEGLVATARAEGMERSRDNVAMCPCGNVTV